MQLSTPEEAAERMTKLHEKYPTDLKVETLAPFLNCCMCDVISLLASAS